MAFKGKIDEELRQKAIDSVNVEGLNFRQAGKKHGLTGTTIRGWVDPEYAAARRKAINEKRIARGGNRQTNKSRKKPAPSMPAVP